MSIVNVNKDLEGGLSAGGVSADDDVVRQTSGDISTQRGSVFGTSRIVIVTGEFRQGDGLDDPDLGVDTSRGAGVTGADVH
jgi:hypothetical protein